MDNPEAGIRVFGWNADVAIIVTPTCASVRAAEFFEGQVVCGKAYATSDPNRLRPNTCEAGDTPLTAGKQVVVGNPICLATGDKIERDQDYATADGLLTVSRNYRSAEREGGSTSDLPGFGRQWRGLLPGRLIARGVISGGQVYSFDIEYQSAESTFKRFYQDNWSFQGGEATRSQLIALATPEVSSAIYFQENIDSINPAGEFKLAFKNGDYVLFSRAGHYVSASENRLLVPVEQGFANGYKIWFDYSDTGQYPHKVRDSFNRQMILTWQDMGWASAKLFGLRIGPSPTPPAANAYLEKAISAIQLPDNTMLQYGYGVGEPSGFQGRLENVTHKNSVGDVLWSRSFRYEDGRFPYAITGKVDQNGERLSTYAYDAQGKAISTERAGGFDRQLVSYGEQGVGGIGPIGGPPDPGGDIGPVVTEQAVTNPLGRVTRYRFITGVIGGEGGNEIVPLATPPLISEVIGTATENLPEERALTSYADGQITGGTDANGNSSSQELDAENHRPISRTDSAGVVTTVEWHPTLDLPTRTVRKRLQTDYAYDAAGQVTATSATDLDTGVVRATQIEVGVAGRILSVNGPKSPDPQGLDDISVMTYDAQGNLSTATNALGHITRFEGYDPNGRAARVIDANGVTTEFSYDALGRVREINAKHPVDATKDATTTIEYDVEGRVTAIARPDTASLRFDYNLAGLLTATRSDDGERIDYTHDAMGNVLTETVKRADGTQARSAPRSFDELGRLLTLTLGTDRTVRLQYDKVGNPTKVTSARGNAVDQAFDPLNRLVSTLAPDGGKTDYGYAGGRLSVTGPGGTFDEPVTTGHGDSPANELGAFRDPNGVTTRFIRNAFGQVIEEVSPDRGTLLYEYDAAGDMTAMVDGRGQRIEYTRDILGRVTMKTPVGRPLSERVTYTYDTPAITGSASIGRLSRIDDGSGATRFGYDHRGNMVTRFQKLVGTPDWVALRYAYDLGDRIETITYPSGRQVRYVRDAKGRVVGVRTRARSAADWTIVSSNMSYEAFGALKTITHGNGTRMIVARGDDGRLDGRRVYRVADSSNISHLTYAYDADDNITRITDRLDATKTVSFAYDPVGRLKRVTAATGSMQRTDYVFDGNGNRTKKLVRPLPSDPPSAATVETYQRGLQSNRLASITGATGTRSLTYDARGNLTQETRPGGVSVSAAYDGHARLISYSRSGEPSLTHVYNGMDERVATTRGALGAGSDTRRFVYAPDGRVLGEYGASASDVKAEFIWMSPEVGESGPFGGDDGLGGYMPLAVAVPTATAGITELNWVHSDHLGVPIWITDASGMTIAQSSSYTAPAFPGQSRTLVDLYYNKYRDYDPTTGRYIQADPIGLAGGASPYSYAMNSPVRYTDPTGLTTYWEYLTGTPDSYRVNIMNGIAGLSDSATFGLTNVVRDLIGVNDEISDCNSFYEYGEWGSFVLGTGGIVKYGLRRGGDGLITEGIYELTGRTGMVYVGQSGNIPARLLSHIATRKISLSELGNVMRTEVLGGRTAREIAEQLRINALGGIRFLENERNPIGYARRHLVPEDPRWFR